MPIASISKPQVDDTHDTQTGLVLGPQYHLVFLKLFHKKTVPTSANTTWPSGCFVLSPLTPLLILCLCSLPLLPGSAKPSLPPRHGSLSVWEGIHRGPSGREHIPSTAGTTTTCCTSSLALSICAGSCHLSLLQPEERSHFSSSGVASTPRSGTAGLCRQWNRVASPGHSHFLTCPVQ